MTFTVDGLQAAGITCVDSFLSPAECTAVLYELRFAFWRPSAVVNRDDDGTIVSFASKVRQSESTSQHWFSDNLTTLVAEFERRLYDQIGFDPACLEPWQATHYGVGGRFDFHDDAGLFRHEPSGERAHSILLYLDQPNQGGGTEFLCLDVVIEPQPGRLVVWDNLRPDGRVNRLMRHASLPVLRGTKTTLVTWGRQYPLTPDAKGHPR